MNERKIIVFGILFLCFSEAVRSNPYSYAENTFDIVHVSSYVDENGIMHVFGEVKNIGNRSMTNVTVSCIFLDSDSKTVNEFRRSSELRIINSGSISPFEILFLDRENVDRVKNFTLYANGTETGTQPLGLRTRIESSRLDLLGFYYVNGVIFNNGSLTAHNSIAIATLYDSGGRVVAIGRGLAEPTSINSKTDASFGLAVIDKPQTQKAKDYSIIADSDEYVSMPTKANVR
jgi:hypothetical protein